MRDHKTGKETCLRDVPGFVASTAVVLVEQYNCDGVDGGDSDRNLPVKCSVVEFVVDTERGGKSALVFWWREGERIRRWRDVE